LKSGWVKLIIWVNPKKVELNKTEEGLCWEFSAGFSWLCHHATIGRPEAPLLVPQRHQKEQSFYKSGYATFLY